MALLLETGKLFILVHWVSGDACLKQASTITPSSPDVRKNLHLKLRQMDGGTTLNASESGDFTIFGKLYSLCFLSPSSC